MIVRGIALGCARGYDTYLSELDDGFDVEVCEDEEDDVFWEGE